MGLAGRAVRAHALAQLVDGGENLIAHLSETGIHQQNAVGSNGNRDVAARAGQHINVAANRDDLDVRAWAARGRWRRRCERAEQRCFHFFAVPVRRPDQLSGRFGVHCVGAAHGHFDRQVVFLCELAEERVGAGHVVRHVALGPHHFLDHVARIRWNLLVQCQPVFRAANHGLRQIDRIVGDQDPRQVIAAPDPILRERRQIAGGDAVAPVIILFEMRGGDLQHVADKFGRGEAAPGVGGEFGGARAAIHVVRIVDGAQPLGVPGRDLARDRVHFFPDPHLRWPARDVHRSVRPALPLRQRLIRRFPSFGAQQRGVAQRNPDELADIGIAGIVFVLNGRPLAGEIHLGESRASPSEVKA